MRTKVALIFGGRSLESDISVITAMQALAVLKETDRDVVPFYLYEGKFYTDGVDDISAFTPFVAERHTAAILVNGVFCSVKKKKLSRLFAPDVLLLCCHGGEGENGVVQAVAEFNGLPQCGAGVLPSAVCMDKTASKCVFEQMLLNVVPYLVVSSARAEAQPGAVREECERALGYPVIVKPASQGSSIGIKAARDAREFYDALETAAEFDDKLVIEQKLTDFKEVNCAAYLKEGRVVLSATERPLAAGETLTFEDKYMSAGKHEGSGRIIPADIGEELNGVVRSVTERIYRALDLKGVVRADFLVDVNRGKVYINEVNTLPGSMAFYLFEPVGVSFSEMLDDMIEEALRSRRERKKRTVFRSRVLEFYGREGGGGKHGRKR